MSDVVFSAAETPVVIDAEYTDPAFDRDRFLLRQRLLSINEKYDIADESGASILFVERPRFLWRRLLMLLVALGAFFVAALLWLFASLTAWGAVFGDAVPPNWILALYVISLFVVPLVPTILIAIWLEPYRHITFYTDQSRSLPVLRVNQVNKFMLLWARYQVTAMDGQVLAHICKNHLTNFVRKCWCVDSADGECLCLVKEDSVILALGRRLFGPVLGVLRTNFILLAPDHTTKLGEFNRKLTLLDRYVLDLTPDPQRTIDRRIAVAVGVMLDTGEGR
jgi:uncharacterized protein YxjI